MAEVILEKLKSFDGDFLTAIERTSELMVGFVEGMAANKDFKFANLLKVVFVLFEHFGGFLKTQDETSLKLNKLENEVDENFFADNKAKEAARHAATYRVQAGAAEGKSICDLKRQNFG